MSPPRESVLLVPHRSILLTSSGWEGAGIQQRCAWDLLREGMVHAHASVARDPLDNPPRLDLAWRLVKHELGEDVARRLLIDNPAAIIQGGVLGRKPAVPIALGRTAARGSSL